MTTKCSTIQESSTAFPTGCVSFGGDEKKATLLSRRNRDGRMALHFAVAENNVEMIELLRAHGGDPEAKKPRGNTILHMAAALGKKDVFKWLVRENILSVAVSWTCVLEIVKPFLMEKIIVCISNVL